MICSLSVAADQSRAPDKVSIESKILNSLFMLWYLLKQSSPDLHTT